MNLHLATSSVFNTYTPSDRFVAPRPTYVFPSTEGTIPAGVGHPSRAPVAPLLDQDVATGWDVNELAVELRPAFKGRTRSASPESGRACSSCSRFARTARFNVRERVGSPPAGRLDICA